MPASKPVTRDSPAEASERLLVRAAQADPKRFAELYEAHFEPVYAFIARRVRDRSLTEDLTSEVFRKALEALPRFDWRGVPFGVWLIRIAANAIADQWKRAARESTDDPPEPTTDVDYDAALERAKLFRLVDALPIDQRRVIEMRFSEGRSIREIGDALRKTDGAVKQLQFRALQTLRVQLTEKKPGTRHGEA